MRERRTNFLSRPKFQIKWSMIMAAVAGITSVIVGSICYFTIKKLYYQFVNAHYQISPEMMESLNNQLVNSTLALGLTLFVFILALMGLGILLTHRVAGPMTKMVTVMDDIMLGAKIKEVKFRRDDEFKDVAEKFTEFLDYTERQHSDDDDLKKAS